MLFSTLLIMCILRIANAIAIDTSNPFCVFSPTHLLCPQELGENCNQYETVDITTNIRDKILHLHNYNRQKIATGFTTGISNWNLAKATDMLQMRWNDTLAQTAQVMADRCVVQHTENKNRKLSEFDLGENFLVMAESSSSTVDEITWENKYFQPMFDENNDFDGRKLDRFDVDGRIGHFTQIIRAETYLVGCAGSRWYEGTGNKPYYSTLLVCHYAPAGNNLKRPLYKRGTAASDCPTKTSHSTTKDIGLCSSNDLEPTPENPLPPPQTTDKSAKERPTLNGVLIAVAVLLSNIIPVIDFKF